MDKPTRSQSTRGQIVCVHLLTLDNINVHTYTVSQKSIPPNQQR